jgi:7,8-dihydropterin-6-yl-methyl-4-(beta-D-ribofuranosyl)aminobenzene 5'-phosphate synthase
MKVTILSDNRTISPDALRTEHGLAILLNTGTNNILLDTGASGLLVQNAVRLGVDLSKVDYVFLSHGHADHTGGLGAFLQVNSKAKILVSPHALDCSFYSDRGCMHSITNCWPSELMQDRLHLISNTQTIVPGIQVIADIQHVHPLPMGNRHLYVERDGQLRVDDFGHEMALYTGGMLFTGCAHNGLENILAACPWPVQTVIGGFHLLDAKGTDTYETTQTLTALAHQLSRQYPDVVFYTGHCTGQEVFNLMKSVLTERLHQFSCGMQITI